MKSFFRSLQKRAGLGIFSIVLLALLFTSCPGAAGGGAPETPDTPKKPTELDFKAQTVGMAYCTINWNWLEGYYFKTVILSTKEDFSSDNKSIDFSYYHEDQLPYTINDLKPGTNYYIRLAGKDADRNDFNKDLSFKTSDKGPLDKLKIEYDKDKKCVKFTYDYVRETAKINNIKVYRKIQPNAEWTLIDEGYIRDSKFWSSFEDYEYTPNVENFYKIELYDEDGNNLGEDVTSELSIIPEDEDDVLDIKVADRGYSYLDLLWDYSLFDSYKITFTKGKTSDPVEYSKDDLPAGKSIHFYFPKDKFRTNYSNSVAFTIECYKNSTLEKTVQRSFEIKKTGAPENLTSELAKDNITLQWNAFDCSNDAIAKVYRRINPASDYELIDSQKYWFYTHSDEFAVYKDETFVAGTTNYYKVELYKANEMEAGAFFGSTEVSCDASSKCSITFDLGEKRNTNYDKKQFVIEYFDKGTDISSFDDDPYIFIADEYKDTYEVDNSTWLTEDGGVFDFNTIISDNIILSAVYMPLAPSVKKYLTDGNKIYLSWNKVADFSYKIEYGKKDDTFFTAINCGQDNKATLENLEEGQEYVINLYSISDNNISKAAQIGPKDGNKIKPVVAGAPQNTEWLVIMYMDGDNNLNNPIYLDMNEVEYGLSKFKTTDHIRVIALWDGYSGDANNPITTLWGPRTTHLLELGPDARLADEEMSLLELSDKTFDWSFTADWIVNDEVNMSSKDTLQNYLEWVKAHFSGTKTILQFSNHGAGPRSILPGKDNYGRRAMCWDDTDGDENSFLKTKDVSTVLSEVGLKSSTSGATKIDLIIEDVCLGSTIEEAYQYKDYAKYFIGSPNTVPGFGLDYDIFIPAMEVGAKVTTISNNIVAAYKRAYQISTKDWKNILDQYNALPKFNNSLTAKDISLLYDGACGLTLVDLNELVSVKTALNTLAGMLLELKGKNIYVYDTNGKLIEGNFLELLRDSFVTPGNPIYYQGGYTWLYDIGAIMDGLLPLVKDSNIQDWLASKSTKTQTQWVLAVDAVRDALSPAIVSSWRDGYLKPSYDTTESKYSTNAWIGTSIHLNYYGLSICGGTVEYEVSGQETTLKDGKYPTFYETELQFGIDCSNWNLLLKEWFLD